MERFSSTNIGSFFTAVLLAGAILLGGCSDSLTGTTPPTADEDVTVQKTAEHNTNGEGEDTDPSASHNTSDED
ncbi:MAG: hypothetical protein BRD32_01935 [Bacteroidetes bacterium QH_2_64_74]|nr:MAG: hypothetical protein BRD32_01935 [Bacteroidetes bacterium QH_2_64_74]